MSNVIASTEIGIVPRLLQRIATGGLFLYPLAMHYLIVRGMMTEALLGLAVVGAVAALVHGWARRDWRHALPYALVAVAATLGLSGDKIYALYFPPIVINIFFALGFGRTLRDGETPMIERFMALHHPDGVPDASARFARQLTRVWTVFFISMAVTATVLALFASIETWSMFANLISYVLVLVLFIGQFVYGAVRYRTPPLADIVPVALQVARRVARGATLDR